MVFLDHPVHLSLACLCNMCWCPSVLLKSDFQFQEKVTGRQIMHVKSKDCVDVGEKLESNSISLRHLAPMQDQTHSMSWCTTSWMSKKKKNDEHASYFPPHLICCLQTIGSQLETQIPSPATAESSCCLVTVQVWGPRWNHRMYTSCGKRKKKF